MARINGWLLVVLCMASICTSAAEVRAQGGGDPLGRLRERYPDVGVYESNGRVVAVFGEPMTRGATPDEAASAFIADHGALFASALDLRLAFRTTVKDDAKAVFGFTQRVEGLPVDGSNARIVVHDTGALGRDRWAVVSAAGNIADPNLPLPERLLTGPQALEAARNDPRATGLSEWGTPTEVLAWERGAGPRATTRAWQIRGSLPAPRIGVWTFIVDARTGQVIRAVDNVFRAVPMEVRATDTTITGTVEGWATPGLLPDTYPDGCDDNEPELVPLKHVQIQVVHNGTVYSSTYTAADGSYSIAAPTNLSGEIRAILVGPEWTTSDWEGGTSGPPDPPANYEHSCVEFAPKILSVTNPGSVVDFEFNTSSHIGCDTREFCTAAVNAHRLAVLSRDHLFARASTEWMPCIDAYVNYDNVYAVCNGYWIGNSTAGNIGTGMVPPGPNPPAGSCANSAYSSVFTHEFGHHVVGSVLGFESNGPAFHEGAADTWMLFVLGTPVVAQDLQGCDFVYRDLSTATNTYPDCSTGPHTRGLVLGRAWWDIWCNFGTECASDEALGAVQDLHVAWLFLTTGEQSGISPCSSLGQSAGPFTLIEVLTADDDDASLSNGTPHEDAICAAFAARNIGPPSGYGVCADRAPWPCRADCDRSTGVGRLDVLDYLCFQNKFYARNPAACDMDQSTGSGVCDVFDFIAFQAAYLEGCP